MKVVFTNHAKIRLSERKIPVSFIKQSIQNPDNQKPTFANKIQVQKKFGDQTLEIIYARYFNKIIIITFYYL